MKSLWWTSAVIAALGTAFLAHSEPTRNAAGFEKEKLIGGWRLAELKSPGADGKVSSVAGVKGTLIYTRDGHMSVQVMYPEQRPPSLMTMSLTGMRLLSAATLSIK